MERLGGSGIGCRGDLIERKAQGIYIVKGSVGRGDLAMNKENANGRVRKNWKEKREVWGRREQREVRVQGKYI